MKQISEAKTEKKGTGKSAGALSLLPTSEDAGARRWCVAQTKFNQERLALENLQRQGFEAYLPMRLAHIRPKGQPPRTIALPFFPRYIFVHVDLSLTGWRGLYATRGVTAVLGQGDRPSKVVDRLVLDIQKRETAGFVELNPTDLPCPWKPGDKVTWQGVVDAVFQARVDANRVSILLSMLGTDSIQVVDIAHIE